MVDYSKIVINFFSCGFMGMGHKCMNTSDHETCVCVCVGGGGRGGRGERKRKGIEITG